MLLSPHPIWRPDTLKTPRKQKMASPEPEVVRQPSPHPEEPEEPEVEAPEIKRHSLPSVIQRNSLNRGVKRKKKINLTSASNSRSQTPPATSVILENLSDSVEIKPEENSNQNEEPTGHPNIDLPQDLSVKHRDQQCQTESNTPLDLHIKSESGVSTDGPSRTSLNNRSSSSKEASEAEDSVTNGLNHYHHELIKIFRSLLIVNPELCVQLLRLIGYIFWRKTKLVRFSGDNNFINTKCHWDASWEAVLKKRHLVM